MRCRRPEAQTHPEETQQVGLRLWSREAVERRGRAVEKQTGFPSQERQGVDPGAALGLLQHSEKVSTGPLDELVLGHEDNGPIAPISQE